MPCNVSQGLNPKGHGEASPPKRSRRQGLEAQLGEKLGASVRIEHGGPGGSLTIRYHSLEELEGIVDHLL
ncbi:MAG: hypothetical protein CM1200mP36_09910 [Gammaproteobacteria bacterium]|nr:MAG: hypothetical protein CM1200mP36_09910 [Gammaproteobacteria bacterium]